MMASQRKRMRTCSADIKDYEGEDLMEVKEEPQHGETEEPKNILFNNLTLPVAAIQIKLEPLSNKSCEEPCSSNQVAQVPLDASVAAELTSEFDIKEEPTDGEQDTDCDVDPGDSNSDDLEKEVEPVAEAEAEAESIQFWSKDSSTMKCLLYSKQQKLMVPLPTDPYKIFRMIFDTELLDLVVKATNAYGGKVHRHLWRNVSREEILRFLGLILHTGTIRINRLSDYWKNHYLFYMSGFTSYMARARFMELMKCLNFSIAPNDERVAKIKPVLDHFNKTMAKIYCPGVNLTVSESMAYHEGHLLFNNHKRNVSQRNVTTVHALGDPEGMVLKMKVTHGKINHQEVVLDLLDGKLNCGHAVYLSEPYNSVNLAAALLEQKTYCTGPLGQTIRGSPHLMKSFKKEQTPNASYYQNGIHICKVKKTFYISTQHDEEMIHVPTKSGSIAVKSKPVIMYNSVMQTDSQEEMTSMYPCQTIGLKWRKKLFIHILQQAVINAYYLNQKYNEKKWTFFDFRLEILESMLPNNPVVKSRVTGKHVLTKIEKCKVRERTVRGAVVMRKEVVRKECRGCKLDKKKKRRSTSYECRQCEGIPGYCMDCFCLIHTTSNVAFIKPIPERWARITNANNEQI